MTDDSQNPVTRADEFSDLLKQIVETRRKNEPSAQYLARLKALIGRDSRLRDQLQAFLDGGQAGDAIHVGNIADSKAVAIGRGASAVNVESVTIFQGDDVQIVVEALQSALEKRIETGFFQTQRLIVVVGVMVVVAILAGMGLILGLPGVIIGLLQPNPEDFLPPALEEVPPTTDAIDSALWLRDVAAEGGYVWFATREGVVLHSVSDGSTRQVLPVSGGVQALAAQEGGDQIWLSPSAGGLLTFSAKENVGQPLDDPAFAELDPPLSILTIQSDSEGGVWLGDLLQGVSTYDGSHWEALPFPAERSDVFRVEALAPGSAGKGSVWATDGILVFLYDGESWSLFERFTTGGEVPTGNIRALLQDGFGHIWIGHGGGVSVLVEGADTADKTDDVWRECDNEALGLPEGIVYDMALAGDGSQVWLVSTEGLARVTMKESPARDCRGWRWRSWPESEEEDAFWDINHEYRIAVDEHAGTTTVWIINRQRGQVKRLSLP